MKTTCFIVCLICFSWSGFPLSEILEENQSQSIIFDQDSTLVPLKFDEKILDDYSKDPHFDYSDKETEENWWTQFKTWLFNSWNQFWRWLFGDYESNSFLVFLLKALPYLIIFGILAFIIWLFYRLNPGARLFKSKIHPEVFYSNEEKIIKSDNIDKLIEDALTNQDLRLAIRFYYLKSIKQLNESEFIEYQFDKTNADYIDEIKNYQLKSIFQKLTYLYEYIWYGNFVVSNYDFSKAQALFIELNNLIPKSDE